MQRGTPILILLTVVVGLGLFAVGRDTPGKPDFSGSWELNAGKSDFGKAPAPTRMTLRAERRGDVLHATQTRYDQAGGPEAVEGDWYLDGKEHPIGTAGEMTGKSWWDGNVLVSERKSKDGSYDEVIRMTLSGDGKVATEIVSVKSSSESGDSRLVWERR